MYAIRRSFTPSAVLLAGLSIFTLAAPAQAIADYTIDCNQTQGPPYVDSNPDPAIWYSTYLQILDGAQERIVTVNILNCDYHSVHDDPSGWIFSGYVGTSADEEYTVTIPVGGSADVGGYNTSPAETNFTIRFENDAPSDGGGTGDDTDALAQTGSTDATSVLLIGAFVGAVGLSLFARRGRLARG